MSYQTQREFHLKSVALALLAAAAACAASLLLLGLLHATRSLGLVDAILIFGIYFVGSLGVAALLGLPILFVLRPMGLANGWSTVLIGATLGALVGWTAPGELTFNLVPWFIAGTLAGLAAWWVWGWAERRYYPDAEMELT
jgi:hypothetical protein